MNLFVFGLGYSASHFVRACGPEFTAVSGTVRTADKAAAMTQDIAGLHALTFEDRAVESRISEADAIIVSIAPSPADPALERFEHAIASSRANRIVYLSTIGVYGAKDGVWVDEYTDPARGSPRSQARLDAEASWFGLGARTGKRVFVLRLAGIYGPGRNAVENLKEGSARRIVRTGQVFNRIHVADIAGAISACLATQIASAVFNVCDDEPAPQSDVVTHAADLLGISPPPETPFDLANLSPMARGFWANNQRVSNRKLKALLDVKLRYPTYREGLAALAGGL